MNICLHSAWKAEFMLIRAFYLYFIRKCFKRVLMDNLPLRILDSTCSGIGAGMSSVCGGEVQGESPYSSLQYLQVLRRQLLKPAA